MKKPSLKKFMIRNYEKLPGSKEFPYHKLILITAAGMICGMPVDEDEDREKEEIGTLFQQNHESYQKYRRENDIPEHQTLPGNDGYIMLKDVSIMANNQITRLNSMVVFCDEVIGVTIGMME